MSESVIPEIRKPGIVLFAAILNFISASMMSALCFFSLLGLIFGSALGVTEAMSRQISDYAAQTNVSFGINIIFAILFAIGLISTGFYIWQGISLLRGKKAAWFIQIALSVLGLLWFPPFGTILSIVILVFFFQNRVRDHFKV